MDDKPGREPAPRRADAVANRKRLLEAARAAFAELGANAEVKDISERAGVGVGTIYRHFANKEDLLREVMLEGLTEFERESRGPNGEQEPLAALRTYMAALLRTIDNYGWLFDAAIGGHLPEHITAELDDRKPDNRIETLLEEGVRQGILVPELDVPVAANVLLGLSVSWKYGRLRELMTLDDAVDRSLHLFLSGASAADR